MARTINISLPPEVMERLDLESKSMGVNRSAYISMTLNRMWQSDEIIKNMPDLVREISSLNESLKAGANK